MNGKIQELLEQANSSAKPTSSVNNAKRSFQTDSAATEFFDKLKRKLFQIDEWNTNSALSSFELFDENGNAANEKKLALGDFIRITLPGTGKSDWVRGIDIHEAQDEVVITVQPSYDPTEDVPDKSRTSHFFTDETTNNFCLQRHDKNVNFYVIGINEKSNTEDTKNIVETARNLATANAGYFLGVQKAEWTTFCKNFLENGEH